MSRNISTSKYLIAVDALTSAAFSLTARTNMAITFAVPGYFYIFFILNFYLNFYMYFECIPSYWRPKTTSRRITVQWMKAICSRNRKKWNYFLICAYLHRSRREESQQQHDRKWRSVFWTVGCYSFEITGIPKKTHFESFSPDRHYNN
jgi:hypothetical protein